MNRNRVVLASILSLAIGILCETAETSSACDYCHSPYSTFYRPYWGVNTYSAYYAPSCSTSCYQPAFSMTCCRPICHQPCCPNPCASSCCPNTCPSGGCPSACPSGGCDGTLAPVGTYQPTTSPY